jgi:hypothetical protein
MSNRARRFEQNPRRSEIIVRQIERHAWTACDDLVDKFCAGDINETDFVERGLTLGMPHTELTDLIGDLRAEDGV